MLTDEYLKQKYPALAKLTDEELAAFRDHMSTLAQLALEWYIDKRRSSKSPSFGSCQDEKEGATMENGDN